jgi:hypothetical protein
MGDKIALGELPIKTVLQGDERSAIAQFLKVNNLAEPIVEARGIDSAAILRQKMDFIVADVAAGLGEDLTGATRSDLRAMGRRYFDKLPAAWRGLSDLVRWAEDGGAPSRCCARIAATATGCVK